MTTHLQRSTFRVSGMDCGACATKITAAVKGVQDIENVTISVSTGILTVEHGPKNNLAEVVKRIAALGYGIAAVPVADTTRNIVTANSPKSGVSDQGQHGHARESDQAEASGIHGHDHGLQEGPWWKGRKGLLTIACGFALIVAFALGKLAPAIETQAYTVAMLVGLGPIAWRAFTAARYGTPFSIETLMTVAAVGAVFIGAAEEAAAVVFLFLIGELLEGVAAGRARSSIRALTGLVPKTAWLDIGGQLQEVPAESLSVGSSILVRPGDRIPADGEILAGDSQINEAPVTGESLPKTKRPGDPVFAGTINGDSALRIRVTAAAADNTIARVVRLVEEAQEAKAPTERLIDRFARYYTPGVMIVAALVAVLPPLLANASWSEWTYKGLAILLIGCPCALVISVPASIAASLSAGARRGLLLKGGAVLESARKVTIVCFDKTGTLTAGKPVVTDFKAFGMTEEEALALAAAVETGSSHPFALAILAKAAAQGVKIPEASDQQALSGKGVTAKVAAREVLVASPKAAADINTLPPEILTEIATLNDQGKSVSLVLVDQKLSGLIAMRDEPREDAKSGLAALKALGVRTLMLTGDNRRTAEAIGKQLGIEPRAELLPEDKLNIVEQLRRDGHYVAKVGDGINDAPALAAADIGIAMGGGTDVALETADAAALHSRVGDIAAMIELSRATIANVRQNIVMALGFKAVFLVTTVAGVTGLWPAILADTGATVLVTANALRLLNWRRSV